MKGLPFVNLVAAKLLQVALDMDDERDIQNHGREHHKHRDDPKCQSERHEAHSDSRHKTEAIGPDLWIEVSVLVPVLVGDCDEDDTIDDLSWSIRKH